MSCPTPPPTTCTLPCASFNAATAPPGGEDRGAVSPTSHGRQCGEWRARLPAWPSANTQGQQLLLLPHPHRCAQHAPHLYTPPRPACGPAPQHPPCCRHVIRGTTLPELAKTELVEAFLAARMAMPTDVAGWKLLESQVADAVSQLFTVHNVRSGCSTLLKEPVSVLLRDRRERDYEFTAFVSEAGAAPCSRCECCACCAVATPHRTAMHQPHPRHVLIPQILLWPRTV